LSCVFPEKLPHAVSKNFLDGVCGIVGRHDLEVVFVHHVFVLEQNLRLIELEGLV